MKRCYSLKRNKEFKRVYRIGKSQGSHLLVLIHAKSKDDSVHIGLSVSKKLGNSVKRNRIKRRLRAALTPFLPLIKEKTNIIFIAREPVKDAEFSEITKSIDKLLKKASLLKQND
ncbi:MAG: ribonuclease P protein component [Clostridia bacterium]|nr:ribonuclease P protein component [Clostridia bacterium]